MAAAVARLTSSRYDRPEIVSAIKATVAKGASDAQLCMFLEVCRRTGLDPFLREIWYVADRGIIMAARDGYLRIANESPQFNGMTTTVDRDEKNIPIRAICTVWRKDRDHPISCEAYYSEYAKSSDVWRKYPSAMIAKVAEVLALKRSFAINGVVTEEEIGYDGRGSVEAAQEVARKKIAEMRKPPQLAAALSESVPEPEDEDRDVEPESELESELRASIIEAERARNDGKPYAGRRVMLQAFESLKERYRKIGFLPTYGAILARYSVQDATEFPETEDGVIEARCAHKEMSLDVANREARHAQRWGAR